MQRQDKTLREVEQKDLFSHLFKLILGVHHVPGTDIVMHKINSGNQRESDQRRLLSQSGQGRPLWGGGIELTHGG